MDRYKQTILFFQFFGLFMLSVYSEDTKPLTILVRHKRDPNSSTSTATSSSTSTSTCSTNCSGVKIRPICASDGRTYPSRCEVKRLHDCEGRNIKVAKKGPCSDSSKCFKERHQAQQLKKKNEAPSIGIYIPECNPDGTFAKVQCHKATQYCWCTTDDGKPIPGSSVRSKKPKCRRKAKRNKRKRGSKRSRSKQRCSHSDRSTFNTNLITLFTQEYQRVQSTKPNKTDNQLGITELPIKSESDSILDTPEKRVVEWKFSELDTDQDNQLKKKEIRSLTRMVRKLVKPKSCARNFVKHCDLDQNRKIARNEWSVCLGVDLNKDQTTPAPSSNGKKDKNNKKGDLAGAALWSAQLRPKASDDKDEEEDDDNDADVKDCSHERKVALELHRTDPNGRIFIPKCAVDGKFERAQCHESTGYCWCVDANSGKPIPGTSTFKVTPDCDKAISKIIPGCPMIQKKRFLTALIDAMTQDMVEWVKNNSDTGLPESDPNHSLEERVVRWKLKNLDMNNNKALERREIRNLKMEIRKNDEVKRKKSLRKCARSFVDFCDSDKSKRITMDEWIQCMGVADDDNQQGQLPRNPKRRGPNPFIGQLN